MDCFSPKGHVVCYPTVVRAPSMSERTKSLGISIVKLNSLSLYLNIAVTIRESVCLVAWEIMFCHWIIDVSISIR